MGMNLHTDGNRTGRHWTNRLWANCPFNAIRDNPGLGTAGMMDFPPGNAGDWTTNHIAGTSTIAASGAVYGGLVISAGAATDTHGANVALGAATSGFITPSATSRIWFECLIKQTLQTSTLGSSFVGLSTQATTAIPLTTTGALATSISRIGFNNLDSADWNFNYLRSGATAYTADTGDDAVTDEWMKLGFFLDGLTSVTPYINSLPLTTIAATSTKTLPNAVMNLTFSVVSGGGTGTPTMTIDWVRWAFLSEVSSYVTL